MDFCLFFFSFFFFFSSFYTSSFSFFFFFKEVIHESFLVWFPFFSFLFIFFGVKLKYERLLLSFFLTQLVLTLYHSLREMEIWKNTNLIELKARLGITHRTQHVKDHSTSLAWGRQIRSSSCLLSFLETPFLGRRIPARSSGRRFSLSGA